MGGDGRDKQWGVLTPPPWIREELCLQTQLRWGRGSQAGNLGVSEKVRRQDAADRDETGEQKRVNPQVQGGDQRVHGTLILHSIPPNPDSSRGGGKGRWGQEKKRKRKRRTGGKNEQRERDEQKERERRMKKKEERRGEEQM